MNRAVVGLMTGIMAAGLAGDLMAQDKASWADNVKIGGDVRFRYQQTDEEGKDTRERWRFRARLNVAGKVNDQVDATVRLVTNTGDPISDNQTMTGWFDDKNAAIDRAFLTWKPVDGLALRFGKMSQPWIAADDLVFSGDVNPEGIAANYAIKGDAMSLMLHGGAFVAEERRAAPETMLYSGQAAVKFNMNDKDHITVGATMYMWDNVESYPVAVGGAQGNTVVTVDPAVEGDLPTFLYANGYELMEAFVQAGMTLGAVPVNVALQYVVNGEASGDDAGMLGSVSAKLANGISLGYQYREVEKDAILGYLGENTDFGQACDAKGHIPYISYAIGKNYSIKVQYAMGTKGLSNGTDIDTFKIDLAGRF